jgi:hypothetical protein
MNQEMEYKDSIIRDLASEIESYEDILEEREMEVRFWGMKYDSIKELR